MKFAISSFLNVLTTAIFKFLLDNSNMWISYRSLSNVFLFVCGHLVQFLGMSGNFSLYPGQCIF